jgi:hypothetical protein
LLIHLNKKYIDMKKINLIKNYLILSGLLLLFFASCRKDTNGVFSGTGAPVITSVRTVSKTDSTAAGTIITYDTTGTPSTTVKAAGTTIVAFDSTTVTGKLSNTYALIGKNLGTTTKILINGVSIYFNRALNSDNIVVFTIPATIPTTQPQANTIVLSTLHGTVTYAFTVLPPLPSISVASDYNFTGGEQLTFKGLSFASVTAITLKGTTTAVTIVSKTDTTMVVKMPVTTLSRANLLLSYGTGSNAGTITTSQEFIDLDNAYVIFDNNNYQNGWIDNSWAHPSGLSTAASHSGTSSIVASYPANGWQIEGSAGWNNSTSGIVYDPTYKYLTFWAKGGKADHQIVIVGDQMVGGYGQVQNANAYAGQLVTIPAGVWTYFKIPLVPRTTAYSKSSTSLNFWANATLAQQLGFFLQGGLTSVADVDETLYFDEIAFVK